MENVSFNNIKDFFNRDVKSFNKFILSFVCISIILVSGFLSYIITNSYALFTSEVTSKNNINIKVSSSLDTSGANVPVLSEKMIPVYYDEGDNVWRKADSNNKDKNYKWYDYDDKMWANAVTYDQTKVLDLSNANNDGEIVGAIYKSNGVSFDGKNDYMLVNNTANYNFGNQITVGARFKVNEFGTTMGTVLIDNLNIANGYDGFEFFVDEEGKIVFKFWKTEDGAKVEVGTDEAINLNEWYTAVATYDGYTASLYINGVRVKYTDSSGAMKVSPKDIKIGINGYLNKNSAFTGTISDAFVSNEVLDAQTIGTNYNDSTFNFKDNENTLFYYNLRGYESRENGSEVPMDIINTMLVWVPRYKYKVWNYNLDGTVTSEPQEIEITFEKGENSTGEIECIDNVQGTSDGTASETAPTSSETCKLNNVECTDELCNGKTYTHPAFTFGTKQLEGIWIGKFELSSDAPNCTVKNYAAANEEGTCNVDTIRPLVKPNETSWRGAMISVFETSMLEMNEEDNKYGFSSTDDTHMIKNSEWGAVAYLSHSKYGINKEIAINSANTYTTGCGPQSETSISSGATCNAYNTSLGQNASATENIYGIYDMSGGTFEHVMGNIVSPDGKTMLIGQRHDNGNENRHSGYSGILYYKGTTSGGYGEYKGTYSYPKDKYIDKYSFTTNSGNSKISKLGDAIREVLKEDNSYWYGDYGYIPSLYSSWYHRGGIHSNGDLAGVFYSGNAYGIAYNNRTSRLVISQ